jgi:glycosyltransferase involved in cell wall biosynthesis
MKKFKVLFVSSDKFPPFRIDVAVLFGKEFSRRGHKIDYLLQSESDNDQFFETSHSGGKAFVGATDNGLKFLNRLRKHGLSIFNDLRCIRLSKANRYDCILVKDKFIAALIGILVSKVTKCKFFFWLSYPFPEADIYEYLEGTARYPYLYFIRGSLFKFLLYSFILPNSDHAFVQSDQMKKDVIQQGIAPDMVTPVPMGIDLEDYYNTCGSDADADEREPNSIIYLGTMQMVRRIDFVIRVFKKVLTAVPEARLYMVGGSENKGDLDFLKAEAKRLNVEHAILFTGNLPREQALKLVRRTVVGVSPFFPTPILNSTSPTKLMEYMIMGTCVVANDHPEQRQVIEDSKAGYCVPYDEDSFAAAIIKILKSPEKSALMGESGIKYVLKRRNYKVIADDLEKKFHKFLPSSF